MKQDTGGITAGDVEAVVDARRARGRMFRGPWSLIFVLTAVCAAGFAYWRYSAAPASPSGNLTYVTRPAEIATITLRVNGTGSVQPTNKVDISSELSGIVREVRVDYNSIVKAGDVLAVLDSVKLVAAVENSSRASWNCASKPQGRARPTRRANLQLGSKAKARRVQRRQRDATATSRRRVTKAQSSRLRRQSRISRLLRRN